MGYGVVSLSDMRLYMPRVTVSGCPGSPSLDAAIRFTAYSDKPAEPVKLDETSGSSIYPCGLL
jgi:hypothetical protein